MKSIYEESKIERFSTIVPCGYSKLKILEKEKSVYYVKRGFFQYMERPYIINPFVGDVMEDVDECLEDYTPTGNPSCELMDKNGTSVKKETVVDKILQIVNVKCGFENNKGNNEGSDDKARTLKRLVDHVRKQNNVIITQNECLSLYKMYMQEWIYLLVCCKCDMPQESETR